MNVERMKVVNFIARTHTHTHTSYIICDVLVVDGPSGIIETHIYMHRIRIYVVCVKLLTHSFPFSTQTSFALKYDWMS